MYLGARVGGAQEVADGTTGDGGSGTWAATLDLRDGIDGDLFLAETGFDVGNDRREDDDLGNHFCSRIFTA